MSMSMMNLASRCVRSIGCRRNFSSSAAGSISSSAAVRRNVSASKGNIFSDMLGFMVSGYMVYTAEGLIKKYRDEDDLKVREKREQEQRERVQRLKSLLKIDEE